MRSSESCHWYDAKGKPCYTVMAKTTGKDRPTTLADARKMDLVPSVTTIMSVAAKPQLEQWKRNQLMMAFLTLPKVPGESLESLEERLWVDAESQSKEARERGIAIHGMIEHGFMFAGSNNPYFLAVKALLDEIYPNKKWIAEKSFACEYGYGGKIDLHADGVVVDFKTKDFKEEDKVEKFIYSDHGMQLAAYGTGVFPMGIDSFDRVNIFICPMKEGEDKPLIKHYVHTTPLKKDFGMFMNLLHFWQASKNFNNEGEK